MQTGPKYKKKNEIRASKLTHGFHCRLNYAASVGCGADDGLDFDDVASFVAVLSQQSSCAPSVGDHTFWDFWLLRSFGLAVPQVLLQTGSRPKKTGNKETQKHCRSLKFQYKSHKDRKKKSI